MDVCVSVHIYMYIYIYVYIYIYASWGYIVHCQLGIHPNHPAAGAYQLSI